jgi:cytoskeleton protein RodZ
MSDTPSHPDGPDEISAVTDSPIMPSVGQQLKAARDARGMSVTDIAKALRLSSRQVEAMEQDDWGRFSCTTIIRGFVRNYSRLVGLDQIQMMQSLDSLHLVPSTNLEMPPGSKVRMPQDDGVARKDYVRVFSGFAILLLAVLTYFFLPDSLLDSTFNLLKSTMQPSVTHVRKSPSSSVDVLPVAAETVTTAPASAAEQLVTPVAELAAPPVSEPQRPEKQASEASLVFTFNQPSWVEIRDRTGEIIFSQLSPAGSRREIAGKPPFALVVGNASNVTLLYKGSPVDMSKRSKDDVARVTVE